MQVGLWEGMCYMRLSPGGLGYPGGIPTSQVLPCDMTRAKVLMCPILSAMLHCLVLRDASLPDSKLSILLHTARSSSQLTPAAAVTCLHRDMALHFVCCTALQ